MAALEVRDQGVGGQVAGLGVHARVIRGRPLPCSQEVGGQGVGLLARGSVDDGWPARGVGEHSEHGGGAPAQYASEFQQWVKERIERKELDALADYRSLSPHGARAHPTEEHSLPLFVALGAAREQAKPERIFGAIEGGALAMDAYLFH